MKKALTVAILATAGIAASANANLIAYWNFNNSTPNTTSGQLGVLNSVTANAGLNGASATISLGGGLTFNTVSAGTANGAVGTFAGDAGVINGQPGEVQGGALSIQGRIGGSGSQTANTNGGTVTFNINTAGYSGITMAWSGRGTGSGFSNNKIETSVDGVTWVTQVASYSSTASSFSLFSYSLNSAADNAANLRVRITFNGATTGAGNNRLDNVSFTAAIPTPGSLALVGVAGLVAARRRRA
ncbi:MAG: hypothetical protein SFY95_08310 [Planctomycetota bacterium]|nr:hypothetical protein [Planctomycetota bacterium]